MRLRYFKSKRGGRGTGDRGTGWLRLVESIRKWWSEASLKEEVEEELGGNRWRMDGRRRRKWGRRVSWTVFVGQVDVVWLYWRQGS